MKTDKFSAAGKLETNVRTAAYLPGSVQVRVRLDVRPDRRSVYSYLLRLVQQGLLE